MEARWSVVQSHPQLHHEFKASLNCVRPCVKKQKQTNIIAKMINFFIKKKRGSVVSSRLKEEISYVPVEWENKCQFWRGDSEVKNMYCSWKGPEPHQAAHNWPYCQLQGGPDVSVLCAHAHTCANAYTTQYIQIIKTIENKCDLNFSLLGQAISSADILEVKSYSCRPEAPSPKFAHFRNHLVRESISKVRFRMWSVSAFVQLQRKEATFSGW